MNHLQPKTYALFITLSLLATHSLADAKPKKSASLPTIEKVFTALESEHFRDASKAANSIARKNDFFDIARFQVALSVDPDSIEAADRMLADLQFIQAHRPYSTTISDLSQAIGRTEAKKAALMAKQRPKEARTLFETAFQHIGGKAQFLDKISKNEIDAYVSVATKPRSELSDAWLSRIARHYPKNAVETESLRKWASENSLDLGASNGSTEKINQSYKAGDSDTEAYLAAMKEIIDDRASKSIDLLQSFLNDYPKSSYRHRVRWWLSKFLEKKGKADEAKKLREQIIQDNPFSLFAILSAKSLNRDLAKELRVEKPVPPETSRDVALTPQELVVLERAERLISMGAPQAAAFELRDLRSRESFSSSFLTYLTRIQSSLGNTIQSFGSITELLSRNDTSLASERGIQLIFPRALYAEVSEASKKTELDPVLVFSLTKQESGFDKTALSSSGAKGLMQLMPFTATDTRAGIELKSLSNTRINVEVGSEYLASLVKRFEGNWALALAGYNAGPYAVDRWLKAYREKKEPTLYEFIESIPYKETREYVSSIMRNYWWYSKLLDQPEPDLDSLFWKKKQSAR